MVWLTVLVIQTRCAYLCCLPVLQVDERWEALCFLSLQSESAALEHSEGQAERLQQLAGGGRRGRVKHMEWHLSCPITFVDNPYSLYFNIHCFILIQQNCVSKNVRHKTQWRLINEVVGLPPPPRLLLTRWLLMWSHTLRVIWIKASAK